MLCYHNHSAAKSKNNQVAAINKEQLTEETKNPQTKNKCIHIRIEYPFEYVPTIHMRENITKVNLTHED